MRRKAFWVLIAVMMAILWGWAYFYDDIDVNEAPDDVWIKANIWDEFEGISHTHWRGGLLFQKPEGAKTHPTLVAVASCVGTWDSPADKIWQVNLSRTDTLSLISTAVAQDGTNTWHFRPPLLPDGEDRKRKYRISDDESLDVRVKTLRIEVVESPKGWLIYSVDKVKRGDKPWTEEKNYFVSWQGLKFFRKRGKGYGSWDLPSFVYFQDIPWPLLHYRQIWRKESCLAFPRTCQ